MLAIILSCNVSFRQSEVSVFKPQPRYYLYLLRFVSTKYPEIKNNPILIAIKQSLRNSIKNNHLTAIWMAFVNHKKK